MNFKLAFISHLELCTRSSNQLCHYIILGCVKRAHIAYAFDARRCRGVVNYCINMGPASATPLRLGIHSLWCSLDLIPADCPNVIGVNLSI